MESKTLFLTINPKSYFFFKNILEGYDGLAILSNENIENGIVKVTYCPEGEKDLFFLLASLAKRIS